MDEPRTPMKFRPKLSLEEETELYRSAMTPRFGRLISFFFSWTFTAIKPDLENLPLVRKAASEGLVVYIMRSRSVLDYLYFNWYCTMHGLPLARFANGVNMLWWSPGDEALPTIWRKARDRFHFGPMPDPVDSGFMSRTLRSGYSVLLFLRRQPSWWFHRPQQSHRDLIEELIQVSKKIDQKIYLVPQIVMWETRPEYTQRNLVDLLFGERENPGRLRKLLHFLAYHRGAVVRMGEPIDLRKFLDDLPEMPAAKKSKKLRLLLRGYLYREKRLVKGPTVKPRSWLLDRIRESPRVQQAIRDTATKERRSIRTVERRADRMLDRIAADFRFNWILGARILFDFVLNRIYAGVEFREDDAERIRRAGRKGTVVFVPCHRSHLDYILISWCVFHRNILPPHIAAGANLGFWPLGTILRRWGAFFLRRSFSGDELYTAAFSTYVQELVREGYPQEFFIEGTRSRTGALLPPRVGMLSMYLDAAAEGVAPDVLFMPISLSYEKVVEEGAYRKELSGGDKQTEDLRGLAGTTSVLWRRYGRVYVRVAEPLSAMDILACANKALPEMSHEERKAFLKQTGERILWEIHRTTPVTPSAAAATVLLSHDKRGMLLREFHRRCQFLIQFLRDRDAQFSNTLQAESRDALDAALQQFADNKQIRIFEEPDAEDIIAIEPDLRMTLDYYKNNIINHLSACAMLAVAVGPAGRPREEVRGRFDDLRQLFALEFRSHPERSGEVLMAAALAELIEAEVLEEKGDEIRVLGPKRAAFFRSILRNLLESYRIVLRSASALRREPMTERRFLDFLQKEGRKLYMTEDVTRSEAVSKIALRNAVRKFLEYGIIETRPERPGELWVHPESQQHYGQLVHQLMEDR